MAYIENKHEIKKKKEIKKTFVPVYDVIRHASPVLEILREYPASYLCRISGFTRLKSSFFWRACILEAGFACNYRRRGGKRGRGGRRRTRCKKRRRSSRRALLLSRCPCLASHLRFCSFFSLTSPSPLFGFGRQRSWGSSAGRRTVGLARAAAAATAAACSPRPASNQKTW